MPVTCHICPFSPEMTNLAVQVVQIQCANIYWKNFFKCAIVFCVYLFLDGCTDQPTNKQNKFDSFLTAALFILSHLYKQMIFLRLFFCQRLHTFEPNNRSCWMFESVLRLMHSWKKGR